MGAKAAAFLTGRNKRGKNASPRTNVATHGGRNIVADTVLSRVHKVEPIDWAGGNDIQKMNVRRAAYITARHDIALF